MPLISDEVKESLVNQIGMEKENANLYLSIAAHLKARGLDNIAKIFEEQHNEEQTHAKMLFDLLTDLNEDFTIPTINSVEVVINSMSDLGELYLQREIQTTESLKEIRNLSAEMGNEGCSVVEVRLIEMLRLQQNELEESTTFRDKCSIIGSDWKTALLWDASLE